MCKIIGIANSSKYNRKALAWLLAKTIEEHKRGTDINKFKLLWTEWLNEDSAEHGSTEHVILDSFGEHILSQVKLFCPVLIPYDLEDTNTLESVWINPYTFELSTGPQPEISAQDLYKTKTTDCWMTVGQFIMYFAHYVMKGAFGERVWLNIATSTAIAMDTDDVRIYWDCKTQAEIDYIVASGGKIIKVLPGENDIFGNNIEINPNTIIDFDNINELAEEIFEFTKKI